MCTFKEADIQNSGLRWVFNFGNTLDWIYLPVRPTKKKRYGTAHVEEGESSLPARQILFFFRWGRFDTYSSSALWTLTVPSARGLYVAWLHFPLSNTAGSFSISYQVPMYWKEASTTIRRQLASTSLRQYNSTGMLNVLKHHIGKSYNNCTPDQYGEKTINWHLNQQTGCFTFVTLKSSCTGGRGHRPGWNDWPSAAAAVSRSKHRTFTSKLEWLMCVNWLVFRLKPQQECSFKRLPGTSSCPRGPFVLYLEVKSTNWTLNHPRSTRGEIFGTQKKNIQIKLWPLEGEGVWRTGWTLFTKPLTFSEQPGF